jgi:hypothetical protein
LDSKGWTASAVIHGRCLYLCGAELAKIHSRSLERLALWTIQRAPWRPWSRRCRCNTSWTKVPSSFYIFAWSVSNCAAVPKCNGNCTKIWKAGFVRYFYVQSRITRNHGGTIGKANVEGLPRSGEQSVLVKID